MKLFQKDYNKAGKGVFKNEPKKRGFFRFCELYLRNFWMLISAQFWYILLCLPLATCGLGQVGMAYVCRMAARDRHVFVTSDFFGAIKRNWKRALPLGIINLCILAILAVNIFIIFNVNIFASDIFKAVVFVVTMFMFTLFSFAKFYQYTLMITFDYSLKTIFKNSWLFATLGIKHNVIIGGILTVIYLAAYWLLTINVRIGMTIIIIVGIFVFPAFRMFLIQYNVFPEIKRYIIDPYYKEHPDADIEKRRELGLIEEENDESIFADTPDSLDS